MPPRPKTTTAKSSLVSVIMPLFNHRDYVGFAIESILAQSYKNWELIIIDDGSTDGSGAIAKNYQKKDPRVRYYYQPNQGEYSARNHGLRQGRGDYIAWLDADDLAPPAKLQTQVNFLQTHPDVAACGTACTRIDKDGHFIEKQKPGAFHVPYLIKTARGFRPRNPLRDGPLDIVGATIMVRRGCYTQVGVYRAVDVGTDYDMLLRLEEHYKMVSLPDYLYDWRLHDNASIQRVKKSGYHGRLGISLNRLVVNLSCLARRLYGIDPLNPMMADWAMDKAATKTAAGTSPAQPLVRPPARPLARPGVFFLFWRWPRLWFYIPTILRINKMSLPEFVARLLWAGVAK